MPYGIPTEELFLQQQEARTHYTLADLYAGENLPDSLESFLNREIATDGEMFAEAQRGKDIQDFAAEYLEGHDWPLEEVNPIIHAALTMPPFVVASLLGVGR